MPAPLTAFQVSLTCDELRAAAASPVGGAGAGGAPPNTMPDTKPFIPAVRFTVTDTVPPAATLIEALAHAPWEKSLLSVAVWGPLPSLMVMVSRLPSESKSIA